MDPKAHDYAPNAPPVHFHSDQDVEITNDKASVADTDTTATGSSDEFDWDEDDEKRNVTAVKARRMRLVYVAFMKLARPIRTLLVALIGGGIFITPLLVGYFQFKDSSARMQVYMWSLWLTITWAAACVTYLVVDLLPRVIISLVMMFNGKVERLKIQVELSVAVSGWLKLVLDISWGWIALGVIRHIYDPPQPYWTDINRVMQAFFGASIILLVEKLGLHLIAIKFHQKALADRIADNQIALRALDRLSNAHPKRHTKSMASVDLTQVQASPKPNFRKERRHKRKAMTSVILDQVRQVALKDSELNKARDLGGLHNARRLARKLFGALNGVYPPRAHILVEDFYPYFRSATEAQDAFAVFDKDGNGDLTKKEMREAVQNIYRERKALVSSLKDASSAVRKLDAVMLGVAFLAILFVFLLIFNRANTVASLVPLGTIILGFSFIFGNAASTLFESLIFIFSTHVFDVGDLILIDDQPLFVREFGLFATTFRRVDGQEIVAPNALLASAKTVHNLRRSNSMWETTTLVVSYNTPLEDIEVLKGRIKAYVAENSRDWSGYDLNIDKMEYQNAIHIIVAMEHRKNWQDWGGRWARRTAFMKKLKAILEDLDVRYYLPVQPMLLQSRGPMPSPRMQPPPLGLRAR
ncbi:hypothetical protein BDZ89DRAFT_1062027 [Hymenopellis radicata]|nr:hypothetical protein BDZ89DRAFT_1062027 [Hymenopellis radicata]